VTTEQAGPRDRDRVMIPGAVAWPAVGVLAVFIAGWLYQFAGVAVFAPWWLLGSIPILAALGQALARTQWGDHRFGVGHERAAVWFSRCCALVAGGWLAWSGWATPGAALPLLLLAAAPLWLWFVILSVRAPKAERRQAERYEEGRHIVQERGWRQVLDRAGCDDVVLTEVREHRAGVVLTVEPDPEAKRTPGYDEFAGRARTIATQAAMHYRQTQGTRLPRNAVRPEPGRDDAEFLLHVTTKDVFTEATTYVPDYVPGSIVNALDLGEYEDAARLLIELASHLKIVGATGSGKSNLANNIIGRITGCADALVWVAATDKLIPLVWPWVRGWFEGSTQRPVLDWVAGQTAWSVLQLLRGAYRLACERNARLDDESKMRATSREPVVFVMIEEVSHAIEFTDLITTHDGQDVTVGDLIKMITQAGRSANVRVIMMSQFGINAALGERAPEIIRNVPMRICLRTMEGHDGSRTLPGLPATVNTATLTDHTMFVQPNADVPRAFPAKAPHLEGTDLIGEVAARHAGWRPDGIEPESAIELGDDYAGRWSPDRVPELALRVAKRGWTWPTLRGGVDTLDPVGSGDLDLPGTVDISGGDDGAQPGPGGPQDGGGTVDTTAWTDEDEAAVRALLGPEEPPRAIEDRAGEDEEQRPAKAFDLGHLGSALDRMNQIADDMERNPAGAPGAPGEEQDGPYGRPLPDPLDRVIGWLDGIEVHPDAEYRTESIALAIEWDGNAAALGKALSRYGLRTKNLAREYDPQQRKGYRVRDLREAATRWRFRM
jgi:hypothetical protein